MNNMARAQGALVQLAGALVAIVVTSIGILIGIGVVFVAYCWLQEIGEEIADDWRTRPRRPARG